jgi:DNA-binding NarL/FixJ family response regulator
MLSLFCFIIYSSIIPKLYYAQQPMSIVSNAQISICIVDDSVMYRDALVSFFKTHPKINILFEASNGLELVKKLRKNHPQVVLLDMEMPVMDGMQALKVLRDKYPSIKFIVLTMHAEKLLINNFLALGANSYLNKEATPQEIYEAIENCYYNDFHINQLMTKAIMHKIKKKRN